MPAAATYSAYNPSPQLPYDGGTLGKSTSRGARESWANLNSQDPNGILTPRSSSLQQDAERHSPGSKGGSNSSYQSSTRGPTNGRSPAHPNHSSNSYNRGGTSSSPTRPSTNSHGSTRVKSTADPNMGGLTGMTPSRGGHSKARANVACPFEVVVTQNDPGIWRAMPELSASPTHDTLHGPPPAGMRGAMSWGVGPNAYENDGRPGTRGGGPITDMEGRPCTRSQQRPPSRMQLSQSMMPGAMAASLPLGGALTQSTDTPALTLSLARASQQAAIVAASAASASGPDLGSTLHRNQAAMLNSLGSQSLPAMQHLSRACSPSKATSQGGRWSQQVVGGSLGRLQAPQQLRAGKHIAKSGGSYASLGQLTPKKGKLLKHATEESDVDSFLSEFENEEDDLEEPAGDEMNDYLSSLDQDDLKAARGSGGYPRSGASTSSGASSPSAARGAATGSYAARGSSRMGNGARSAAQQVALPMSTQPPHHSSTSTSHSSGGAAPHVSSQPTAAAPVGVVDPALTKFIMKIVDRIITHAVKQGNVNMVIKDAEERALAGGLNASDDGSTAILSEEGWQDLVRATIAPAAGNEFGALLTSTNMAQLRPAPPPSSSLGPLSMTAIDDFRHLASPSRGGHTSGLGATTPRELMPMSGITSRPVSVAVAGGMARYARLGS